MGGFTFRVNGPMYVFAQLIKSDSVLLYFEVNYSFSLNCCFQSMRTYTEGEMPGTGSKANVCILGHIVAQSRLHSLVPETVSTQPRL